jgi:crossover junction endodeoxyribonuclease RuvC
MKILGIDPGLRNTGWGVIETYGNRLINQGDGTVTSDPSLSLAERLVQLHDGLVKVIERFQPEEAAVEETFVNINPSSTLKLGQARGIALFVPSKSGLRVSEYSPNLIKKSLVGSGHASKEQVQMMINTLLPGCDFQTADSADALAIAICHAHHRKSSKILKQLQELPV